MFFRILQWKLNDSYLLSTIKMSQPRSKMSFSRVSRVDFWTEKSRGRKPLMSAIYLLFLPYSLGCLSLLLVWQEGNVEGLTSVILQLNPTLGCVCTVCVCVCVLRLPPGWSHSPSPAISLPSFWWLPCFTFHFCQNLYFWCFFSGWVGLSLCCSCHLPIPPYIPPFL